MVVETLQNHLNINHNNRGWDSDALCFVCMCVCLCGVHEFIYGFLNGKCVTVSTASLNVIFTFNFHFDFFILNTFSLSFNILVKIIKIFILMEKKIIINT